MATARATSTGRKLRVRIVCPAPPGSRAGNRITALRWRAVLRALGHRVIIAEGLGSNTDALIVALHARRSSAAITRSRELAPARPIVVALTGTDLYRDVGRSRAAQRSLVTADRLIVLHERGALDLPRALRAKVRHVPQSAPRLTRRRGRRTTGPLRIVVVGHLRAEKDPMRTARAVRALPPSVEVSVVHVGRALDERMRAAAEREMARNPRYRWVGERSTGATRRTIAEADLLVLTSRIEGGANVLSEAIAADVPVLASRIPSTIGVLGAEHPGYFPVGDTRALAALIGRAARDAGFLRQLRAAGATRRASLSPARERSAWRALIAELFRSPQRSGVG